MTINEKTKIIEISESIPDAIPLMERNLEKIDWFWLSKPPNAMHLAMHLLKENLEKIDWINLSGNPIAISLLEQNPEKLVWWALYGNLSALPSPIC